MDEELRRPFLHRSESRGELMGLEGHNAIFVCGAWTAMVMATTILRMMAGVSVLVSVPLFGGAAAAVTLYVLKLKNGKPDGYAADWFSDLLGSDQLKRQPSHPRKP